MNVVASRPLSNSEEEEFDPSEIHLERERFRYPTAVAVNPLNAARTLEGNESIIEREEKGSKYSRFRREAERVQPIEGNQVLPREIEALFEPANYQLPQEPDQLSDSQVKTEQGGKHLEGVGAEIESRASELSAGIENLRNANIQGVFDPRLGDLMEMYRAQAQLEAVRSKRFELLAKMNFQPESANNELVTDLNQLSQEETHLAQAA